MFHLLVTTTLAWVTRYNFNSGKMANGKPPSVGYVACPRAIKLNSRITIDSVPYICGDRTAKEFDGRYDIYDPRPTSVLMKWGKHKMKIKVYTKL